MATAVCGEKEVYGRRRSNSIADKVALFNVKANAHVESQYRNPFSERWGGDTTRCRRFSVMDRSDPEYGRPVIGSKTELRGRRAQEHMNSEMKVLCQVITTTGIKRKNGDVHITFGELFQMYTKISSKLVGTLLRARKHGLLTFEGEMLFQRRDDDVIVTLFGKPQPPAAPTAPLEPTKEITTIAE